MKEIPDFALNPDGYKKFVDGISELKKISDKRGFFNGFVGKFFGISIFCDETVPQNYIKLIYRQGGKIKRAIVKIK